MNVDPVNYTFGDITELLPFQERFVEEIERRAKEQGQKPMMSVRSRDRESLQQLQSELRKRGYRKQR